MSRHIKVLGFLSLALVFVSNAYCADGDPWREFKFFEHRGAVQVGDCPIGWHFPNAREFAEFAVRNGAKGILESKYHGVKVILGDYYEAGHQSSDDIGLETEIKEMRAKGYELVVGACPNSYYSCPLFYYNPSGYTAPVSQLGMNDFVTETMMDDSQGVADYLIFKGKTGEFTSANGYNYPGLNYTPGICVR